MLVRCLRAGLHLGGRDTLGQLEDVSGGLTGPDVELAGLESLERGGGVGDRANGDPLELRRRAPRVERVRDEGRVLVLDGLLDRVGTAGQRRSRAVGQRGVGVAVAPRVAEGSEDFLVTVGDRVDDSLLRGLGEGLGGAAVGIPVTLLTRGGVGVPGGLHVRVLVGEREGVGAVCRDTDRADQLPVHVGLVVDERDLLVLGSGDLRHQVVAGGGSG